MKLIIGLGNVGAKYAKTRHNLGFMVADKLAAEFGHQPTDFKLHSRAQADILDLKAEHDLILAKPTTMMNLSGEAVQALARFYKIGPRNIWVIYDDFDLPFGQIRVRLGGSSAGHNGIKSLIQHVGDDFWRVRLGIANKHLADTPTINFVLDKFMDDEAKQLPVLVDAASRLIKDALKSGDLADHTLSA